MSGFDASALSPAGPAAASIATLWWVLLAIATVVFAVTMGFLLVALFRDVPEDAPRGLASADNAFVVVWGIVAPATVLLAVAGLTIRSALETASPSREPELTVEVVGHQFWWEVRYLDPSGDAVLTANEIHIPVGEPVRLLLEANDVIHSFWVPRLHGKMDMVPGHTNEFWIEASEAGEFRGICAEFCGIQHARMQFLVVASPRDEFDRWLQAQRRPAAPPEMPGEARGQKVFLAANCMHCHAIRGVSPVTSLGPDLTHLASRRMLAAASIRNERDELRRWILDPQGVKPGAPMPPTRLDDDDLEALLDYLESLR